MNILLITQSLSSGGSERSVAKLSELFSVNYNVYILIIDEKKKIDYNYSGTIIYLKDYIKKDKLSVLKKVKAIKFIKKEKHINVSISFLEGPNFINILSRVNDKAYVSVRGHKSSFYKKSGHKWIIEKLAIRLLYNFSNGVIAASKGIAEDLFQKLGVKQSKVKVIPNFYNADNILKQSKESVGEFDIILANNPVLITTGRLSIPKGHDHLLRIYQKLKQQHHNLKLIVLGDGELYNYFLKYASECNLKVFSWRNNDIPNSSYDVFLTGFVSNPFAYIAKSTLFVFTSLWEGFPNALAEAIICGTPVVTSDCLSGPRELLFDNLTYSKKVTYPLQSKYGLLLPAFNLKNTDHDKDYNIWVESVSHILKNELRKPNLNSSDFVQKFSENVVSKLWLDLLK